MTTTNGRVSVAAVTAVAWALVGAVSCAKGATESEPLSGGTSTGEVGAGGSGGGGGAAAGTGGAGGGAAKMPCTKASQCPENVCQGGVCAAATCVNGKLDGGETDQDCGGPECGPCLLGKKCLGPSDCSSAICKASVCDAYDCTDGTKNGSESDIDCGGSNCPSCGPGQSCVNAADCGGAPCTSGKCRFEVTFTTCGQTGATGPNQAQCDAMYGAGNALNGKVNVTNGYQHYTIPSDGIYQLEAFGAEGGKSDLAAGGAGARMRGDFALKKGDVLKIVVGQRGSDGQALNVGGGGGTFVAVGLDKPLLVAGGGGSAGACGTAIVDLMGAKSTMGDGKGGTSTGDGGYCGCGGEGSGGGGFTGDGGANGGKSFLNGAVGCTSKRTGQCVDPGIGGFGGGGNGGNGGGGGGGYQGGNAGGQAGGPSGRGGLSFNGGMNPSNADASNPGPGRVTIKSL